jgi:hypothetical protein
LVDHTNRLVDQRLDEIVHEGVHARARRQRVGANLFDPPTDEPSAGSLVLRNRTESERAPSMNTGMGKPSSPIALR